MSEPILRDRILLVMRQDAADGKPTTQLTMAQSLGRSRAQVCIAVHKLMDQSMVEKGALLGVPPKRGTYSYRLTKAGLDRANELEASE